MSGAAGPHLTALIPTLLLLALQLVGDFMP